MDILAAQFDGDITQETLDEIVKNYGDLTTNADNSVTLTVDGLGDIDITEIYSAALGSETLVADGSFSETKGVNTPNLGTGMTAIKWDGSNWVATTADDSEWYSYTTTDKQWANAVINGTFNSDGTLDETATGYSMFVWIPRFAYQIESSYHTGGSGVSGTINIKFMKGTTDEAADGTTTWNNESGEVNWNIHPAFKYSSTVAGIWVAKFEASRSDATSSSAGSSSTIAVQPGVMSWRSISVNDIYTNCLNYNSTLGSHMMKNSEWGAVAYLAQSEYGKNSEIWINNSSSFITGSCGASVSASSSDACENDYTVGVNASSTGNVYGIYDLSGGAYEYVAAYVDNTYTQDGGKRNTSTYGASLIAGEDYTKDVYSMGTSDSSENNYAIAASIYGDAVYETSSSGSGATSWNYDYGYFPYSSYPFFKRGGDYGYTTNVGAFFFYSSGGSANSSYSFRPVLAVL